MSGFISRRLVCPFLTLVLLSVACVARAQEPPPDPTDQSGEVSGDSTSTAGAPPIQVTVAPSARELDAVAVPKAFCDAHEGPCGETVSVVARDLTLSGFFEVLPEAGYIADMARESLKETKWEDWFNVGAKYLIKVKVEASGGHTVDLDFRLYDVAQKKNIPVDNQTQKQVDEKELRGAVHKFVNSVIEAITGMPGFFGGRLCFAAKTGLATKGVFSVGLDGYGRRTLAAGDTINMLPSMVGGNALYTSFKAGKPDIYLNGKRITHDDRAYRGARMSPDGSMIAVSADDGGQSDIFLMSSDGKIIKNLTNHWADEVSPTWSPDGSMLAFVSSRTGSPQVYVMNRDGSGTRRVTMAGGYNSTPTFGPGGLIVFAGMDEGHSDIFTVDLEGNMTRITQDQGSNKDPAISPDGRHVAFVSNRGGKTLIWVATIDGRYQFPVTEKSLAYSTLYWAR